MFSFFIPIPVNSFYELIFTWLFIYLVFIIIFIILHHCLFISHIHRSENQFEKCGENSRSQDSCSGGANGAYTIHRKGSDRNCNNITCQNPCEKCSKGDDLAAVHLPIDKRNNNPHKGQAQKERGMCWQIRSQARWFCPYHSKKGYCQNGNICKECYYPEFMLFHRFRSEEHTSEL